MARHHQSLYRTAMDDADADGVVIFCFVLAVRVLRCLYTVAEKRGGTLHTQTCMYTLHRQALSAASLGDSQCQRQCPCPACPPCLQQVQ